MMPEHRGEHQYDAEFGVLAYSFLSMAIPFFSYYFIKFPNRKKVFL